MSAKLCLPIMTGYHGRPWTVLCFVAVLLLLDVAWSSGLRLTNMNAPLVADIREEMELDCHFDMGVEELYAVKWYKDDHEFFRYTPRQKQDTLSFPVAGVHLVSGGTDCNQEHCRVRLRDLTRDHSGGAYRCEISSEAPSFRLASETHNVTVAAVPRENPRIEGLTSSYAEGETVTAKCVSDLADPAPILSWDINGQPAPTKFVGEMTSSEQDSLGLVYRSTTIRFPAERKYSRGDIIELRCASALPGIPLAPQVTTQTVRLQTAPPPSAINNQRLHLHSTSACTSASKGPQNWLLATILSSASVRWWISSIRGWAG